MLRAIPVLLLMVLAGCSQPAPAPSLHEPQVAAQFGSWHYASDEALGDWAILLQVSAAQETECHASLDAQGRASGDQPAFLAGFVADDGNADVGETSRNFEPRAGAGPVSLGGASEESLLGYGPTFSAETTVEFGPGNASVFWAARGVEDVDKMDGGTFSADLECDGPFTVAGRAATSEAFLWNDHTFHGDGYASPAGVGGVGGGSVTVEGTGPFLVAFTKLQADQQSLAITSQGWTEQWDLSGSSHLDAGRAAVAGPVTLDFHTQGFTTSTPLRSPWTTGIVAPFEPVDGFNRGAETLGAWEEDGPSDA